MGKPGGSNVPSSVNESIVHEKGTRATETSEYPEEKKETSLSLATTHEIDVSFFSSGYLDVSVPRVPFS